MLAALVDSNGRRIRECKEEHKGIGRTTSRTS